MSSAFAFGFEDEDDQASDVPDASARVSGFEKPNDEESPPLIEARTHSIDALISGLPSSLQYHEKSLAPAGDDSVLVPQRDFYDIKAQLMAEDDGLNSIPGISSQDLEPRVYEGGFKTWECAEDLSNYLTCNYLSLLINDQESVVLELGAGTALPSCTLLQHYLARIGTEKPRMCLKLLLADYNQPVIEAATIPNIFLTWGMSFGLTKTTGSIEVTNEVKKSFLESMYANRVRVNAISGAWSAAFVDHILSVSQLTGREQVLVLASETIYSPTSLEQFTSSLVQILRRFKQQGLQPLALVASKKIYFGVGGGIDDFIARSRDLGCHHQTVWQTQEGVGRAIVAISIPDS